MKDKHYDIIYIISLGVLVCCLIVMAGLYTSERNKALQYKNLYESSVSQYNDLVAKYNELSASSGSSSKTTKKMLENGNFVSGTDFPAGTYDIEAVSGCGNVYSDNLFGGGINAILGVPSDDPTGMSERKYSNISLPEGTTLTVSGVKIRLTRVGD